MKLTLFSPNAFCALTLPSKCAGQYWLSGRSADGSSMKIVAVEGLRSVSEGTADRWVLKSNSRYRVLAPDGSELDGTPLEYLTVYMIRSADRQEEYRLFTEPLTEDRKTYRVYRVQGNHAVLRIGRSADCDICYANPYMGKLHATLQISDSAMTITDNNSLNRTFLNGNAVRKADLRTGDVVYAMGMQIIVTRAYLYINNPDGNVTVRSRLLQQHHVPAYTVPERDDAKDPEQYDFDDYYYRAPRFKRDVEPLVLKLDPPPPGSTAEELPLLMTVGPSVTMGLASATTAAFSMVNALSSGSVEDAIPSVVMSLSMLSGTLLWPTLTKYYQNKTGEKKEKDRKSAYSAYLSKLEAQVAGEIARQEKILRENDRSCGDYLKLLEARPLQIWERTGKHSDFLRICLGYGRLPMQAQIQYPERSFSVEQEELTEAMYQFGEKERWLQNVPICLPLKERRITGIYAAHGQLLAYAKQLILQLSVLHSYDEVKLVVLYDEKDEQELSFLRWLPHTMDNERKMRYLASTTDEAVTLSADLEQILEHRRGLDQGALAQEPVHYVVLCLSKQLGNKTQCLRTLLQSGESLGFSVIAMCERLKDLPKECTAVVRLEEGGNGSLTLLDDTAREPVAFQARLPEQLPMQAAVRVLANTILDVNDSSFRMPKRYTFLQMLDVGMVEHLNLAENWSVSDPTKSLAAPIGIDAYGDPVMLDLHERAHGPHGLIAGMTGSGKSETIIAYILSMAIHYHPHEVAFVLIDYKGGGMAKAFEKLPHTAGIITNLDGNEINRSLMSMQSELHRREGIFREVSRQHGISNIDIYKYQKLYREGKVSEPLPHLVVISDEFAELKKDQPDFMAALTSTARVGRSLGVHLILATQKPGGVVDDQIRSNSRFRLCLKVQDRGDSTEMMDRPEAASLVDTGRFYLQVGNNEVFKLGQSAWAGASYHPAAKAIRELDDAVSIIDKNGRTLVEVNTDPFAHRKDAPKQLDVITKFIRQVSDEEGIRPWKMWLDPLPGRITAESLLQKYPHRPSGGLTLAPVVGEYDDPAHQRQDVLTVPLTAAGNVLVYGAPGSGKTMFLEAMCCALMREHTPKEVHLYILDFGAETMTAFAEAPHTGDVVLSHEGEKLEKLFQLLDRQLEERKKLLSRSGGSFVRCSEQSGTKLPNIVVMLHNYANFTQLYEQYLDKLACLTREGNRYGIFFVLTCSGVNQVRLNMQQNFKSIFCLQLNQSGDYSVVLGKTGSLVPAKHPGRGMFRFDKDSVLEFQIVCAPETEDRYSYYRSFCRELCTRCSTRAARIPTLPQRVDAAFLAPHADSRDLSRVPVGVEKETLAIARLDLDARPVHVILSQDQSYRSFAPEFARFLGDHYRGQTVLLAPEGVPEGFSRSAGLRVCADRERCIDAVSELFQQVLTRNNAYKTALAEGRAAPVFKPLFVVLQSVSALQTLLEQAPVREPMFSDDSMMNRLLLAISRCSREYGVRILLADTEQSLRSFCTQPECRAQISKQDFLWIGNGLAGQYWWNVTQKPQGYTARLEPPFGFAITGGKAVQVKFLQEQEEDV